MSTSVLGIIADHPTPKIHMGEGTTYMEVIGLDFYNQCCTGDISMTLRRDKADSDHIPCVLVVRNGDGDIVIECKK